MFHEKVNYNTAQANTTRVITIGDSPIRYESNQFAYAKNHLSSAKPTAFISTEKTV